MCSTQAHSEGSTSSTSQWAVKARLGVEEQAGSYPDRSWVQPPSTQLSRTPDRSWAEPPAPTWLLNNSSPGLRSHQATMLAAAGGSHGGGSHGGGSHGGDSQSGGSYGGGSMAGAGGSHGSSQTLGNHAGMVAQSGMAAQGVHAGMAAQSGSSFSALSEEPVQEPLPEPLQQPLHVGSHPPQRLHTSLFPLEATNSGVSDSGDTAAMQGLDVVEPFNTPDSCCDLGAGAAASNGSNGYRDSCDSDEMNDLLRFGPPSSW